MGLTLFVFVERRTPQGWELPLGKIVNPEYDTTTWDRDRYVQKELLMSTNKALRAILGFSEKQYYSRAAFASPPVEPGLPKDSEVAMRDGMYELYSQNAEVWSVKVDDLLAFPWETKTIMRSAYVPAAAAELFHPEKPFPHDRWPSDVPVSYSAMSRSGVSVQWTETYAEAAGEEWMAAKESLKTMEGELRLICVVD